MSNKFDPITGHLVTCKWKERNDKHLRCQEMISKNNKFVQCGNHAANHTYCMQNVYCDIHYNKHILKGEWIHEISSCANTMLDSHKIAKESRLLIDQFNCQNYDIPTNKKYHHISTSHRNVTKKEKKILDTSLDTSHIRKRKLNESDPDAKNDNATNENLIKRTKYIIIGGICKICDVGKLINNQCQNPKCMFEQDDGIDHPNHYIKHTHI